MTMEPPRRSRRLALLLAVALAATGLPTTSLAQPTPDGGPGGASPLSSPAVAAVPVAAAFVGFGGESSEAGSEGPFPGAPRARTPASCGRDAATAGCDAAARVANLGHRGRAAHHASIRSAHLIAPPTAPPTSTV